MKKKKILSAAALIISVLTALLPGCGIIGGELENGGFYYEGSDAVSETQQYQPDTAEESTAAPEETQPEQSGEKYYTMADIAKLKNTGNFADGTLEHIFDGTINKKGNATGYHYTMVSDSKGEIIGGTRSDTDENGVFTAKVKVSGVKKNGFSSFYPESWSPQQVVDAINTAYEDALADPSNPVSGDLWAGYCGDLEIDMYLNGRKKITTAFPIYEGD